MINEQIIQRIIERLLQITDNIGQVADILSSFAAFVTVCLAIRELSSRSKAKRAEESIEIYADYLNLIQQTEYIVRTAGSLSEKIKDLSRDEIKAYAITHMVSDELISSVQSLQKKCIKSFGSEKKNVSVSKEIIDLLGAISNIFVSINTFYQAIADDKNYSTDCNLIKQRYKYIIESYKKVEETIESVKEFLMERVKKTKFSSDSYFISLIIASAAFILLCIII